MAKKKNNNDSAATLGFEAELFKTADKLRGNMEPVHDTISWPRLDTIDWPKNRCECRPIAGNRVCKGQPNHAGD